MQVFFKIANCCKSFGSVKMDVLIHNKETTISDEHMT